MGFRAVSFFSLSSCVVTGLSCSLASIHACRGLTTEPNEMELDEVICFGKHHPNDPTFCIRQDATEMV